MKSGEYSHIAIVQDPDDLPFKKGEVLVVVAKVTLPKQDKNGKGV